MDTRSQCSTCSTCSQATNRTNTSKATNGSVSSAASNSTNNKSSHVLSSVSSVEKEMKYTSLHFFSDLSVVGEQRSKVLKTNRNDSLCRHSEHPLDRLKNRTGSNVLIDEDFSDPRFSKFLGANAYTKDPMGFNYIGLSVPLTADNSPGWYDRTQGLKPDFATMLFGLMKGGRKPNMTIEIGGETFECHLLMLQCYSQLFQNVIEQNWLSLNELGLTMDAFRMAYEWMLARDTPLIRRHTILPLFNAAMILMIDELEEQCWRCLDDDRVVREYEAFILYQESKLYRNLGFLRKLLLARVCKYFLALVASPAFLELEVDEVCSLLSAHSIAVNTEAEVMMSGIRWLKHKEAEREQYTVAVMSCVRFILMPTTYLVTLKDRHVCEETAKVARNGAVKQLITTSLRVLNLLECRDMTREDFGRFLVENRSQFARERQWILDQRCRYHHHLLCRKKDPLVYDEFETYLELLRDSAAKFWVEYPFADLCLEDASVAKCSNRKCVNGTLISYRDLTHNPQLCEEFGLNVLGQSPSSFVALHAKLDDLQAGHDRTEAEKRAIEESEANAVPADIREKTLRCYGRPANSRMSSGYDVMVTNSSVTPQLVQGSSLRDQDSFDSFEAFHRIRYPSGRRPEGDKPSQQPTAPTQ